MNSGDDLSSRCRAYLDAGPPPTMTTYVPDSLTELIIAHAAVGRTLDPELLEIGTMISDLPLEYAAKEGEAVVDYLRGCQDLVREIVMNQRRSGTE